MTSINAHSSRRFIDLLAVVPPLKPRSNTWKLAHIDQEDPRFNEELVPLGLFADRKYRRIFSDPVYTGLRPNTPYGREELKGSLYPCYVRESVADMLAKAADLLPEGYALVVYDSYRSKEVQQSLFNTFKNALWEQSKGTTTSRDGAPRPYTEQDAIEDTQTYVSLPDIENMPHGTGGAVDAALIKFDSETWAEIERLNKRQDENVGNPEKHEEYLAIELRRQELFRTKAQMIYMGPPYDKVALDEKGNDITAFEYFENKKIWERTLFPKRPSKYFHDCAKNILDTQKKLLPEYRDRDLIVKSFERFSEYEAYIDNPPRYLRAAFSFLSPLKTDTVFSIRMAPEMLDTFNSLSDADQAIQLNALAARIGRKHIFDVLRQPDVMEKLNVFSGDFAFHAVNDETLDLGAFRARMQKIKNSPETKGDAVAAHRCYDEWLRLCEAKMEERDDTALLADWTKDAGYEVSFVFVDTKTRAEGHQNGFTPMDDASTEALWARRMFYHVMTAVGFKIYAAESWHVDHGNKFAADVEGSPSSFYGYATLSEKNVRHNEFLRNLYDLSLIAEKNAPWIRALARIEEHGAFNSGASEIKQPVADRIMPPPNQPPPLLNLEPKRAEQVITTITDSLKIPCRRSTLG